MRETENLAEQVVDRVERGDCGSCKRSWEGKLSTKGHGQEFSYAVGREVCFR